MSKSKKNESQFENSIELGKKSKRLVPRIKNWCSNVEIHSEYGGVMGQMGYPTMNTISCTQARGDGAMNLEWIAYDFIVENCPGCKYHKEITPNNFGRETLKNHEKLISKQKEQQKKEAEIISNLETLIQQKISNKHENSNTPELSVLRKLSKLTNPNCNHTVISLELLEASKISPSFFNSLSNDYLSVYFHNEQFGNHLIETSINIIENNQDVITDFFIEKVVDLLEKEDNLNGLLRVLPISRLNQSKAFHVCKIIISRYDPNSFNRYDYFENHSPALLQFIYSFHDKYNTQIYKLLEDNLRGEDGRARAFTSLIIYHLYENDKNLKFKIIDKMILSLDLDDHENYLSPDYIITKTISKIYEKFSEEVIKAIKRTTNRLKTGGKIELLRIYEDVLEKQKDSNENTFLDELISISLSPKGQAIRKKAIDVLESISRTNGILLLDKSDSVIGLLANSIRNQIKFEWYKENLDNNTVTFNPLKNQTIDSILLDENLMAYEIDKFKGISKSLLTINEIQIYKILIDIIRNTNIQNEHEKRLKDRLIEVIRDGVKDSTLLIDILPDIYTWLLDFKNPSLRVGALKLVAKLLKNNGQIVPKTIIDLLEIFLKDQDNWVKKYTILCFKEIIKKDKKLDEVVIDSLLACYKDKYVIIHKTAAEITYDLYEIINPKQRLQLFQNLFHLFWAYNEEDEKDIELCKKMLRQVIYLSKKINPKHSEITEPTLIKKYLADYCINGNYYSRLDSLKDLSKFKNQNSEYEETWLKSSLLFLNQSIPHRMQGFWDSDRYTLYKDFPTLNLKTIVTQIDSFKTSTKKAIVRDFDLYSFESLYILYIFSFFNRYDDLIELIEHIEESVNQTKSINYFFVQLTLFKNFTNASIAIHEEADIKKFDSAMKNLKKIDNELLQLQADIFLKRVKLFYEFDVITMEEALAGKEYLINRYSRLIEISVESEEKNLFIAFSSLCKAVFSFLEWGRAILNGDLVQQAKLIATKANLEMVDKHIFTYLPPLEKKVLELINGISKTSQFNKTSFANIVRSFAELNIPVIYYLNKKNRMFWDNTHEEVDEKINDINLVSIELYLRSVPWANPQIIKPKEVYSIEGKVRMNKVPEGYDSLQIVAASTNSEIYNLQLDQIELTSSSEYSVSGNILFKYPTSDLDQIISVKLVPYYERGGVKMYPSIIGYDELIGRVIDENNELFQTGFDMMNKKVFEFYKNPVTRQLEKSERTDFFRLLNATINYQGFCIQNGVYKKVAKVLENDFRDKLIQHLIANPTIGGQIRKEAEIAGGKVEIEYKGFIIELKVEYKLSDRMKMVSKYESQAQSYASGSSKLASIVCILDLTEKKLAPSPTINNIYLNQPKTHGFHDIEATHTPFQIFVFIDGNTKNPSDYSK